MQQGSPVGLVDGLLQEAQGQIGSQRQRDQARLGPQIDIGRQQRGSQQQAPHQPFPQVLEAGALPHQPQQDQQAAGIAAPAPAAGQDLHGRNRHQQDGQEHEVLGDRLDQRTERRQEIVQGSEPWPCRTLGGGEGRCQHLERLGHHSHSYSQGDSSTGGLTAPADGGLDPAKQQGQQEREKEGPDETDRNQRQKLMAERLGRGQIRGQRRPPIEKAGQMEQKQDWGQPEERSRRKLSPAPTDEGDHGSDHRSQSKQDATDNSEDPDKIAAAAFVPLPLLGQVNQAVDVGHFIARHHGRHPSLSLGKRPGPIGKDKGPVPAGRPLGGLGGNLLEISRFEAETGRNRTLSL